MIAINQNYFSLNLNFDFDNFKKEYEDSSFLNYAKIYTQVIRKLYTLRKILKSNFDNFDTYLMINKLDTVEKIDEVLQNLEDLTEFTEGVLESNKLKSWSYRPILYMIDSVEDANMALQGMLLSKQAHLVHDKELDDHQ